MTIIHNLQAELLIILIYDVELIYGRCQNQSFRDVKDQKLFVVSSTQRIKANVFVIEKYHTKFACEDNITLNDFATSESNKLQPMAATDLPYSQIMRFATSRSTGCIKKNATT